MTPLARVGTQGESGKKKGSEKERCALTAFRKALNDRSAVRYRFWSVREERGAGSAGGRASAFCVRERTHHHPTAAPVCVISGSGVGPVLSCC